MEIIKISKVTTKYPTDPINDPTPTEDLITVELNIWIEFFSWNFMPTKEMKEKKLDKSRVRKLHF